MIENDSYRQAEIEAELVDLISTWDPKYLEAPNVTQKIQHEISFSGLDNEKERLVMQYLEKNIQRLLELAKERRKEMAIKRVLHR